MYLYGTNGIKKFRYQDVLYAIDECMSNVVILTVAPQDTAGIGKPLLASYQQLPLHYNKNYQQIDKSIAQWLKTQPDDYPNMNYVPTKTFADLDSLYFTYTDNFTMTDGDRNNERMYFSLRVRSLRKWPMIPSLFSGEPGWTFLVFRVTDVVFLIIFQ